MKVKLPSMPRKVFLILGIITILLIALVPSYYFYSQYQKTQKLLQNPTLAAEEEVKKIVGKVGKLIELPSSETPTVATVSDKDKLKEQVFFAKSENGDKVLIFTQAKKAILYRPNTNKIIEVAPINLGPSETATTSAPLSTSTSTTLNTNTSVSAEKVKIAIYNGTNIAGQTKRAEASISAKLTNMQIVAKEDAIKKDYQKTVVIDLSGNFNLQTGQLAQLLKGEQSKFPIGEKKPAADILVIIGANFNK